MRKVVLILIFVFVGLILYSQVSGYQGKRLSIEYNNLFFSALKSPNANGYFHPDEGFTDRIFSFNTRNKISADFVLNRRTSVGGGIEFFNTRFVSTDLIGCTQGNDETYVDWDYPIGSISASCYNLHYTFFSQNSIAPLGSYTQLEFGIINYKIFYDEDDLLEELQDDYDSGINSITDYKNISPYSAMYLGFSLGKKRVYFNRLIVNTGVQFCYVPSSKPFDFLSDIIESSFSERTYLKEMAKRRIGSHMLFNINIGVGVLIF